MFHCYFSNKTGRTAWATRFVLICLDYLIKSPSLADEWWLCHFKSSSFLHSSKNMQYYITGLNETPLGFMMVYAAVIFVMMKMEWEVRTYFKWNFGKITYSTGHFKTHADAWAVLVSRHPILNFYKAEQTDHFQKQRKYLLKSPLGWEKPPQALRR